jgi:hypothetical protein
MEGHAALPHGEDFQRMRQVVARLVEQHLAQPAAEDHAEHAIEQQVVDILRVHAVPRLRLRAALAQPEKGKKAGEIHQPVPAHGQRADGNGDRIELGVDQHGGRTSR